MGLGRNSQPPRVESTRVSKSCNHAITWLRKIFENLRKFWNNARKTRKNSTNFIYLSKFDEAFLVSQVFMSFLTHVSAQNVQSEHFDCAKEFAFRQSDLSYLFYLSYLFNKCVGVNFDLRRRTYKRTNDRTNVWKLKTQV